MASLRRPRTLDRAAAAEEQALADAGAQSYLGFQLQRVNSLIGDDPSRRTLMGVAGNRRTALAEWHQTRGRHPGGVGAGEPRGDPGGGEPPARGRTPSARYAIGHRRSGDDVDGPRWRTASLTRLAEAACHRQAKGLPLLLDDPFHQLDRPVKLRLLELLGRSAGDPQIILLTDDDEVAAWARLEALAGDVALIEPALERRP